MIITRRLRSHSRRMLVWVALFTVWYFGWAVKAMGADGGAATLPADPIGLVSTLGFPTVAVVAFMREMVVPKGRLDDAKAAAAEALAIAREANASYRDTIRLMQSRNQVEVEILRRGHANPDEDDSRPDEDEDAPAPRPRPKGER